MNTKIAGHPGIRIERHGAVESVILEHPAALNALTPDSANLLLQYFADLRRRTEVRVVRLTGAGDHFCSGLDIKADLPVLTEGPGYAMKFMSDFADLVLNMRHCPQPIVALLKGVAAGAGMALALASDIRIAAPNLRMNAAFVKLGLTGSEMGLSFLLPRIVGAGLASELMLTGRVIAAEEAARTGLVSRVVDPEQLQCAGDEVVQQLLAAAPLALRLTKEAINLALGASSLETAVAIENRNQALAFQSRMPVEGVSAFKERRPPRFEEG